MSGARRKDARPSALSRRCANRQAGRDLAFGHAAGTRPQRRVACAWVIFVQACSDPWSRQCRFADHPTVPMTPIHSLVVIARNGWSRSIGTPGRNQSDQGSQSAGARSLPTLGRAVPPSPGVVYRCGRATSFPVPHCSSTTATSPNVPAIHTLSPATESGPGLQLVVVPDHQRAAPHIDVLMRRTRTGCRTSGLRDVLMTHLPARDRAALPRRPAGRGSA